jgi:predicted hotdog family 3-hydroxylacyl-ACP dehydratase
MLIGSSGIRNLVPHAGHMCLIGGVEAWNMNAVVCRTDTHRHPDNPLRRRGALPAVHAFEYGGQAAAVHGGLLARLAGEQAPFAYLGALKAAMLYVSRLDDIEGELRVFAELLMGDRGSAVYHCRVEGVGRSLAEARLTIVFLNGLNG